MHSSEATTDIVNLATDLVTAYAGDYCYEEYDDQIGYECDHGKGLSIYYVIHDGGAGVFPIYYNIT